MKLFAYIFFVVTLFSADMMQSGSHKILSNECPLPYQTVVSQLSKILIRVFKHERTLELWGKDSVGSSYCFITDYTICGFSGDLGPKRKEGDGQIPEGYYYINCFNPNSWFHLSMGLDYPNISDKMLGDPEHPGSDIFIHGDSVSVGCIPIGDKAIEELYAIAKHAFEVGQTNIPVLIFPCRMDRRNMECMNSMYDMDTATISFWNNLKQGYDYFELYGSINKRSITDQGRYIFDNDSTDELISISDE